MSRDEVMAGIVQEVREGLSRSFFVGGVEDDNGERCIAVPERNMEKLGALLLALEIRDLVNADADIGDTGNILGWIESQDFTVGSLPNNPPFRKT